MEPKNVSLVTPLEQSERKKLLLDITDKIALHKDIKSNAIDAIENVLSEIKENVSETEYRKFKVEFVNKMSSIAETTVYKNLDSIFDDNQLRVLAPFCAEHPWLLERFLEFSASVEEEINQSFDMLCISMFGKDESCGETHE